MTSYRKGEQINYETHPIPTKWEEGTTKYKQCYDAMYWAWENNSDVLDIHHNVYNEQWGIKMTKEEYKQLCYIHKVLKAKYNSLQHYYYNQQLNQEYYEYQ